METAGTPTRLRGLPSWLISQTAVPAARLVSEGLATARTRRAHYPVLAALDEFGPASQATLSRRCGIYRSDLVPLVGELIARGWALRTLDPGDRRCHVISITPSGERQLRRLDDLLADIQDELLAPLSTRERGELVRLLNRVLEHHGGNG